MFKFCNIKNLSSINSPSVMSHNFPSNAPHSNLRTSRLGSLPMVEISLHGKKNLDRVNFLRFEGKLNSQRCCTSPLYSSLSDSSRVRKSKFGKRLHFKELSHESRSMQLNFRRLGKPLKIFSVSSPQQKAGVASVCKLSNLKNFSRLYFGKVHDPHILKCLSFTKSPIVSGNSISPYISSLKRKVSRLWRLLISGGIIYE
ncbi:unnamed protein product [Coffea canephora]|uniref:Uncharacterized protein n=1 Tax=Coffea canephora TaxID=49390 RepID=A0A068V714_COFCA|nr:unnamed protein product [Coffea canephora]